MNRKLKKEIIELFSILKEDAEMALEGSWDCSTYEGKKGFEAQITLINEILNKLKNE